MTEGPRDAASLGGLLARALHRSWRVAPPPLSLSPEDLQAAAPLLLRTGGAGLVWRRLRASPLAGAPPASALREAHRFHALQGAVLEERLPRAVAALREVGVEAIVAKGWSIARWYPEPGLRPYGDLDLYVHPSRYPSARRALDRSPGLAADLHRGFPDLDDRDVDGLFARARPLPLGGWEVRVLAPEDHLRLLCRHLLRHGAARPVWLCDVALMLEQRAPDFDWDLVLGGHPRREQAVRAALALSGVLLGADLSDTPVAGHETRLPPWLLPTALRQWGEAAVCREPLATYLAHPAAFREELRRHWPNAIEASAALDAPFNAFPRAPFQAVHVLARAVRFALDLPRTWRASPVARPAA